MDFNIFGVLAEFSTSGDPQIKNFEEKNHLPLEDRFSGPNVCEE